MASYAGRTAYKLNSTDPLAAAAARAQPPGGGAMFEQALETFRAAQLNFQLGAIFAVVGGGLIVLGVAWGCISIVQAHPYVVLLLMGLVFMAVAVVMRPGGLLSLLPASVQDFLLNRTVFDMLYDDTMCQNLIRKWGRMLILASGDFAVSDIKALTAGLDPAFTDAVLRRTFFQWLPPVVRTALLPLNDPRVRAEGTEAAEIARAASSGTTSIGVCADMGGPPLTPQRIYTYLQEKKQERDDRITEPSLAPAISGIFGVWPMTLRIGSMVLSRTQGALTASIVACGGLFALLGVPYVRTFMLRFVARGLAICNIKQLPDLLNSDRSHALAARAARAVALVGVLSAGTLVAVAVARKRLEQLRENLPTPTAVATGVAAGEPPVPPAQQQLRQQPQQHSAPQPAERLEQMQPAPVPTTVRPTVRHRDFAEAMADRRLRVGDKAISPASESTSIASSDDPSSTATASATAAPTAGNSPTQEHGQMDVTDTLLTSGLRRRTATGGDADSAVAGSPTARQSPRAWQWEQ